jgi:hypothetical protein
MTKRPPRDKKPDWSVSGEKPTPTPNLPYHYERGNGDTEVINIRSLWHETSDTDTLLTGIRAEYDYLNNTVISTTSFGSTKPKRPAPLARQRPLITILGWSLLDMANHIQRHISP